MSPDQWRYYMGLLKKRLAFEDEVNNPFVRFSYAWALFQCEHFREAIEEFRSLDQLTLSGKYRVRHLAAWCDSAGQPIRCHGKVREVYQNSERGIVYCPQIRSEIDFLPKDLRRWIFDGKTHWTTSTYRSISADPLPTQTASILEDGPRSATFFERDMDEPTYNGILNRVNGEFGRQPASGLIGCSQVLGNFIAEITAAAEALRGNPDPPLGILISRPTVDESLDDAILDLCGKDESWTDVRLAPRADEYNSGQLFGVATQPSPFEFASGQIVAVRGLEHLTESATRRFVRHMHVWCREQPEAGLRRFHVVMLLGPDRGTQLKVNEISRVLDCRFITLSPLHSCPRTSLSFSMTWLAGTAEIFATSAGRGWKGSSNTTGRATCWS